MGKKHELNREYPLVNEKEIQEALVAQFEQLFNGVNPVGQCPILKTIHAKNVACVRAEFIIEPNLPPELQVGLFKTPATYPAWIRFSQTAISDDRKKDSRSLSIKIRDVPGEKFLPENEGKSEQDFLLRSAPVFFIRNAYDFLDFSRHLAEPRRFFFPSLNPATWRLKEYFLFRSELKTFNNLLTIPYWGNVPFRFGENRTFQYRVQPHPANEWKHEVPQSENFLHDVASQFLKNHEAYFDFLIQFQTDPDKMPIEDATVAWKSPLYKVATIRILQQDVEAPENLAMGADMFLNAWNCLKEHEPVGSLNRARRSVYAKILKLQQERKCPYHPKS